MKSEGVIEKKYILIKSISSIGSLSFAFVYSSSLGVVNRSIITYLFVLGTLIWVFVTSGTTLTLRKLRRDVSVNELHSFFGLIILQAFIGFFLFLGGLQLYSTFEVQIPRNLYLLSCMYFLLSGIAMIFIEILISELKYLLASKVELLAVFLQFTFFLLFREIAPYSLGVSLLLAFIFSYLACSVLIALKLKGSIFKDFGFAPPKRFWELTQGNHSIGFSTSIIDRLDKIFIAYFFPIGTLAPYSILVSLISVLRVFPDYFTKLLISHKKIIFLKNPHRKALMLVLLFPVFVSVGITSHYLVLILLGVEWSLPYWIGLAIAFQELARAIFQFKLSELVLHNSVLYSKYVPVFSLVLLVPTLYLFSNCFGLLGIPIAYSLIYLLVSRLIQKRFTIE